MGKNLRTVKVRIARFLARCKYVVSRWLGVVSPYRMFFWQTASGEQRADAVKIRTLDGAQARHSRESRGCVYGV